MYYIKSVAQVKANTRATRKGASSPKRYDQVQSKLKNQTSKPQGYDSPFNRKNSSPKKARPASAKKSPTKSPTKSLAKSPAKTRQSNISYTADQGSDHQMEWTPEMPKKGEPLGFSVEKRLPSKSTNPKLDSEIQLRRDHLEAEKRSKFEEIMKLETELASIKAQESNYEVDAADDS